MSEQSEIRAVLTDKDREGRELRVELVPRPAYAVEVLHNGASQTLVVPDAIAETIIVEQRNGRGDSLRATCARVGEYIDATEDTLAGGGLFGGVVRDNPELRDYLQGKLRDAREFKARVCDPVLGA